MTRTAISPRLATRIFLNRTDGKQSLPVLHRLAIQYEPALDDAGVFRLDLVHKLHRLDDAEDLSGLHPLADRDKGRRPGRRPFIEGPVDGGFYQSQGWGCRRRLFFSLLGG